MDVIFMPKHLIQQRPQCVHILSLFMHFHTRNVYCGDVLTVHVSIFLTKKQIIIIQKQHPQFGFTFITPMQIVVLMVEFHWRTRKYVTCVNKNLHQMNLQNIHQKRASDDEDNHLWFSYQFLHTSHPKVGLSHTTCTNTWYKSLWYNATHSIQMQ